MNNNSATVWNSVRKQERWVTDFNDRFVYSNLITNKELIKLLKSFIVNELKDQGNRIRQDGYDEGRKDGIIICQSRLPK